MISILTWSRRGENFYYRGRLLLVRSRSLTWTLYHNRFGKFEPYSYFASLNEAEIANFGGKFPPHD